MLLNSSMVSSSSLLILGSNPSSTKFNFYLCQNEIFLLDFDKDRDHMCRHVW